MKTLTVLLALLAASPLWLMAQQEKVSTKATTSLSIRALESSVKRGSPTAVEATITNTSKYTFRPFRTTNPGEYYSMDVRRDGVPVAETGNLKHLKKPGATRPEIEDSIVPLHHQPVVYIHPAAPELAGNDYGERILG